MKRKLITINITTVAIFIALGYVANIISPPLLFGLKPDFTLVALFLIVFMEIDNLRLCLAAAIATGIITAITTTFPGGQIPNLCEKPITGLVIYFLFKLMIKIHIPPVMLYTCVSFFGSLFSGFIFLFLSNLFVKLPNKLGTLIITMIVPLALINMIVFIILVNIVNQIRKRRIKI